MQEKKNNFYTLSADPVFKNVFYRDDNLLKRFLTDILVVFMIMYKLRNLKY